MCGLGSRGSFTHSFLVSRRKYSRNLPLRSKFFDVPRKNLAGSGSSYVYGLNVLRVGEVYMAMTSNYCKLTLLVL